MAQTTPELKQIVKRYIGELGKMGIRAEKVFVYGSQSQGTAQEGSDIDLFILSPDWANYSQRERLEILGIAAARLLEPIQAQGFTPEEVSKHKITPFWQQVLQEQAVAV
jgi:predicted nucleotidyltransferase